MPLEQLEEFVESLPPFFMESSFSAEENIFSTKPMPTVDPNSLYWGQQNKHDLTADKENGLVTITKEEEFEKRRGTDSDDEDEELINGRKITVHLVAHSHLDPGWILSIKEYYIQKVKPMLDNIITELWNAKV